MTWFMPIVLGAITQWAEILGSIIYVHRAALVWLWYTKSPATVSTIFEDWSLDNFLHVALKMKATDAYILILPSNMASDLAHCYETAIAFHFRYLDVSLSCFIAYLTVFNVFKIFSWYYYVFGVRSRACALLSLPFSSVFYPLNLYLFWVVCLFNSHSPCIQYLMLDHIC